MKFVAKFVTLICLIGISQQAMADPTPPDVQGFYRGKGSFSSIFNKQKEPPLEVGLKLPNDTNVILSVFEDGVSGSDLDGECMYSPEGNYLFVKFELGPDIYYSGLLKIKGKAGKKSMSGTINLIELGYSGLGSIKLKAKQSLPF